MGESDIYVIRRMPDDTWSQPANLGENINTKWDEVNPSISPDGNVLYFASKGHNSMGGYDLFVSYLNEITGEWSKPSNLGYPVNSTEDNMTISFSGNRRYAYVSATRKEGQGGQDIYRVTFRDVDEPLTVIRGKVKLQTDLGERDLNGNHGEPDITVYDDKGNIYGKYIYNDNLGRFVSALPAGKYSLVISMDHFEDYTEDILIMDRNLYVPEADKTFVLKPKKS
jgi:hypothetical protein